MKKWGGGYEVDYSLRDPRSSSTKVLVLLTMATTTTTTTTCYTIQGYGLKTLASFPNVSYDQVPLYGEGVYATVGVSLPRDITRTPWGQNVTDDPKQVRALRNRTQTP